MAASKRNNDNIVPTKVSYIFTGLISFGVLCSVCQKVEGQRIIVSSLTSPCPDVFSYERLRDDDRWYGNIILHTNVELSGIWIDVILDRTAEMLGNWFGEVSTRDNVQFTITNRNERFHAHTETTVRIFVKYLSTVVPIVQTIRLNGRTICSVNTRPQTTESSINTITRPTSTITTTRRRRPSTTTESTVHFHNEYEVNNNRRPTGSSRPNVNSLDDDYLSGTNTGSRPSVSGSFGSSTTQRPIDWISLSTTPVNHNNGHNGNDDGGFISELNPTLRPSRRPTVSPSYNQNIVPKCGVPAAQPRPLITHGAATSIGQWPWHAALYRSTGIDLKYVCGGSLISRHHVITAAHCVTLKASTRVVNRDTLMLYLGKYHFRKWTDSGLQNMQVREIIVHPDYNSTNFDNDVAVMILSNDVEITDFVRPVCLWQDSVELSSVLNKEGTVVGWGYDENGKVTEQLTQAKMPVVSAETCIYSYPDFFSRFTTVRTYCAGYRNGTSVCNGDSGGGMVFPRSNTNPTVWQLRGIVSLSVALQNEFVCDSNHYVVFADVAKHRTWLERIINER